MRILRRPEVERMTGLSGPVIYKRMAAGTFPKRIPLGTNSSGWLESEVHAWIEERIAERNSVLDRRGGRRLLAHRKDRQT